MLLFNCVLLKTVFISCYFVFADSLYCSGFSHDSHRNFIVWISLTVMKSEEREAQVSVPLI